MEDRVKPSLLNRIVTPIIFLLGGFAALIWFIYKIYMLIKGSNDSVVLVDKGSYYMLGVGIGMLDLAFVIIWEQWLVKPINRIVTAIFSRLAIAAVVLLFALPHIIHYAADRHFTSNGYSVCEEASHQWLFVRYIVYIQEPIECSERLKKQA